MKSAIASGLHACQRFAYGRKLPREIESQRKHASRWLSTLVFVAVLLPVPATELNAHTPYAQWDSFRVRHLQVLTSRSDLTGDELAEKWVALLAKHLPKSKAVVSRARNFIRVASLLRTDQAKVAVLSHGQAKSMLNGTSPFEEIGPVALQVLMDNGSYLLVSRDDLPREHGYLLVATLMDQADILELSVPAEGPFGMQVHPGAIMAATEH